MGRVREMLLDESRVHAVGANIGGIFEIAKRSARLAVWSLVRERWRMIGTARLPKDAYGLTRMW
jgi:hypothetical protein